MSKKFVRQNKLYSFQKKDKNSILDYFSLIDKFQNLIWLILIIAIAIFFRFYKVADLPPSLNWDEISHGYNAYSILKTGKDEWGASLPLIFRAYGDYKLPLYIYLTSISIGFFGLTSLAVRLISIVSGVGLVLLAYLITLKLTRKDFPSLMAAFLTAISPWSLFVSRVAVEANLAAFLTALGFYFLISWMENRKARNLSLVFLSWGFSLFAYNSARILLAICFLNNYLKPL